MDEPTRYSQQVTDYGIKHDGHRYGFIRFDATIGDDVDSVTFLDLGPWGRHRSPVDDPAIAAAGLVAIPVLVMLLILKGVRKWWTRGAA